MHGLHLIADLHACSPDTAALEDVGCLRELCLAAVAANGLAAVGELFHPFPAPGGITGVVLLSESHLAVHTWPELAAVTLDIYVCNVFKDNSLRAQALLTTLEGAFSAARVERHRVPRGLLAGATPPRPSEAG